MSAFQVRQCASMQRRLPHRFTEFIDVTVATFQLQCCDKQERMLRTDLTSAHAMRHVRWRRGDVAAAMTSTSVCWPLIAVARSVSSLSTEASTLSVRCNKMMTTERHWMYKNCRPSQQPNSCMFLVVVTTAALRLDRHLSDFFQFFFQFNSIYFQIASIKAQENTQ